MPRINDLRNRILKAKHVYCYGGDALMSDAEYDALEDELRLLSPDDPVLALVGAPVPPDTMLTKARHTMSMGSQSKVNSEEAFRSWCSKSDVAAIHVSLKGDGASAAAYYLDGRLVQAITRGDGSVGEDITANALRFKGLPAWAGTGAGGFSGSVRFEVILTVDDWTKIDPARSKNPRNAGNGIMGRKNGHQSDCLTIYAFDLDETRDGAAVAFRTETEKAARLAYLGFNVIAHEVHANADDAIAYFHTIAMTRDALPIWIDGVVMKVDDIARQRELGVTAGRPKGQVAWKFDSSGAESVLEGVVVSGGHTGGLYPTAQLRPVEIGGTTVSNASLANYDEIERLDVAIGDSVWVVKANDIIPKIIRVTHRPATRQAILLPSACPFCGGEVGRRRMSSGDAGVIIECRNAECPKKSTGKIRRWIASLDILGIGDVVLEAMIEHFDLDDAAGLYTLRDRATELADMVTNADRDLRLGEKRATSILKAIDATRMLTLGQLLGSLGLEHLGKRRVELMIRSADGTLDALEDWRSGQLRDADFAATAGVPNIGSAIQDGIDAMATVIDKLLAAGVTVLPQQRDLAGSTATPARTVCISGKLPSGRKKADYEVALRSAGYALVDDVSKGLDYLVLADPDSTSSKAEKAKKLGIPVISEEQLLALSGAALLVPIPIPDASTRPARKIAVQPAIITNMDQKMTSQITNAIPASELRYFEFIDEKSSKFWEVRVTRSSVDVCYGKIGTAGQKQSKPFADGAAASKQAEKLIAEKLGKGYRAAVKQVSQEAGDVLDVKKIIGQGKLKIDASTSEKLRLDKKQNLVGTYSKILDLREHEFDAEIFIHLESEFKKAEKKGQLPQANIRLADNDDVEVIYFPNDKGGFYYAVLENLPNLRELYICGDKSPSSVNMDGELKWLICKNLPNLKKIEIEGGVKWLQVEDATKLESIDASQSRMLEYFSIKNCPLINNVIVKNCKKLPDIYGIDNTMKEFLGVSDQINSIQKKSKGNGKIYADMTFSDVDMVLANINKGVELAVKKKFLVDEESYDDVEDDVEVEVEDEDEDEDEDDNEISGSNENPESDEIFYRKFQMELLRPLEHVYTGGTGQTYFYCLLTCYGHGSWSGDGRSSQEACLDQALQSLLQCYQSNIPGLSAPSAEELLNFLTKLIEKENRPGKAPAVSVTAATPLKAIAAAGASPGKTICISGKLPSGRKKADYEVALRSAGYALVDDVVKGLCYLVLADPDSTSSKAEKARKLGISVISEEELAQIIKS